MVLTNHISIQERWKKLEDKINLACTKASRNRNEIIVIGASKKKSPELIYEAYSSGCTHFGENYVKEAELKISELCSKTKNANIINLANELELSPIEFHLIGRLQTNKVRKAVKLFSMIHTVDSLILGKLIAKEFAEISQDKLPVLLQVNISGEPQKGGILPDFVAEIYSSLIECSSIEIKGLMSIGSYKSGLSLKISEFRSLYKIKESIEHQFKIKLPELSMGMSDDFDIAIMEGSTMVRIGTLLFGER
ncbi:MAG TPA: YggS family pyridoxal phosphate-dependent enzyme [Oligoflexia bacterium]|nr:YggS family pyridoxal phosphate-dependent enzyme [Oligoflexia bacterium]